MLAGFAETELTPRDGVRMPGEFYPIEGQGTRGGLFANAAAFTLDGETVILVSADVLSFKEQDVAGFRARISAATGVPGDHILIAAIHTHTGPALSYQLWMCPPDPESAARTADAVVDAAVRAYETRTPAALGAGHFTEDRFSFVRDYLLEDGRIVMNPRDPSLRPLRPAAQTDDSVDFLRVETEEGKLLGFLVNYANHPDCIPDEEKDRFDADYPGALRRSLKRRFGEDVKVLFFNGAAGDVNCVDFLGGSFGQAYDAPTVIGEALAEGIERANASVSVEKDAHVAASDRLVTASRRHRSPADAAWAAEINADPSAHTPNEVAFAAEYALPPDERETVELEVQTIRLGPWAIVGFPSEIFSVIGKVVKSVSPFRHTVVAELSNGTNGYIAPAYMHGSDVYEVKYSAYNSYTGPETAEILIRSAAEQLRELYRED